MNEMYMYACEYLKRGFAIFPLGARSKVPLTAHGLKDASRDPAQIKAWWDKYPNANIALSTGQISGGICVIDMDIDEEKGINGVQALKEWQDRHGIFKPSWCAKTGRGGMHYFFKSDQPLGNRVNVIPAVDIRGDGGYIVAPPSIHPNGNSYQWINRLSMDDIEVAKIDDNIRYLLSIDTQRPQLKYISPDKIPMGERNHLLFKFACMMQAKGVSDEAIYVATKAENEAKCEQPLTDREIETIVASATKYQKGKPIYVHSDGNATQGQREPFFDVTQNGIIRKTWENTIEAIEYDPELYGKIKYNELQNSIFVFGALPWDKNETYRPWKNSDDANLKSYLEKRYGLNRTEQIMDALLIVAERYKFNPICDELNAIYDEYKDHCEGAIRRLLPMYMGAKDSDYHFEVMKLYMLGAICRAFYAGCKFDYSIILYGAQGFGKSEFLRHLAICSEWFNDNFNTFDGDKAIEKIQGMWIVEMAELKALKSAKDAESFKSFLTSRVDTYRAPYSRRSEQRPRMCVFAGTTNNKNVFVDKTGNRRFLPIITRKGMETKNLFGNQDDVMMDFKLAWAEAMKIFHEAGDHPNLILPDEARREAEDVQCEFKEEDYRVGIIRNWLEQTDCYKVCVPQLIESALELDIRHVSKVERREISDIMDNEIEGWQRAETKDKGRMSFGRYGKQVAYIREF